MKQLFIENTEWDILGETGWEDFSGIRIIESKEPFDIYHITTLNNFWIVCTPEHILYTLNNVQILAKDVTLQTNILTINGLDKIVSINKLERTIVYDIINTTSNNTITNGIISHNCDEFAHVPKNQCIDGEETILMEHNGEEEVLALKDLYNAIGSTNDEQCIRMVN